MKKSLKPSVLCFVPKYVHKNRQPENELLLMLDTGERCNSGAIGINDIEEWNYVEYWIWNFKFQQKVRNTTGDLFDPL